MLLHLVRKHSLERTDLICVSNLLDDLSNLIVLVSGLDESDGGLSGFVGSKDDISFLSSDGSIFVRLDNDSMTSKGGKSVDMDTEFNFDKISFFDAGGVFLEG